jgi:hypothetical protein
MRQDFYSRQLVLALRSFHASANAAPLADSEELATNPMAQSLKDSGDSQTRPAQVIRIDDQILRGLSYSADCSCPLGQLLVCAPARVRTIDRFRPQL